ncbi:DUF5054 domain-containing protein [Devosia sp. PTR5]|uniref:DUF5054 domain-containing protein n=1 Tax=Devosia oryzisoli TaxID=2774138 RepID=A0A927IUS1_9HYPH|nr:DUF5054 domain-containing protein [Devosia oryzisoli]MBD8067158.1 DUF5054 domain-containing protein [Devosia oryzisoli]
MTPPLIHLIFKTHLDIGFTDHAARVRRQYHEQFIPQAIATGEHFFFENPHDSQFIWTTGAWLIWDHLTSQPPERVQRLERAIERGLITWHALPFTTHTELMSPALLRAGLSFSQELDRRFGRTTTAAKMTDVPGHTLGMVPILAEAGVRFLHLGVNTASPVPDVPPIFRWRAPDGSELVVMYQGSYGGTDFPAGADVGISFAHTNDNIGPQSVGQTVEALRHLRHEHPEAQIRASTLDAFGAEMWARREQFPIVTSEIGDSWIHGTASDPIKLARFRALQRLVDQWERSPSPSRLAFARGLTMVPEHTWGVDIKTYLRDETAWDREAFETARRTDPRFAYTEQSWAEQRAYMETALDQLGPADRQDADAALAQTHPPAPATPLPGDTLKDGGWQATLSPEGGIASLVTPDGQTIPGRDGILFGFTHESYDWAALQTHLDSYLLHREVWAILDHDKPGLQRARTARTASFVPQADGIADGRISVAHLPVQAHDRLGAPERIEIGIRGIDENRLAITLVLRNKPANRMPEAGFFQFTPADAAKWQLRKMGLWQRSGDIARRGGGQLQAVGAARTGKVGSGLELELLDAALVGPATAPFLPFQPEPPDYSGGLRVNLYNNKWGTNFPMWWEGDALFRFTLSLSEVTAD